MNFNLIFESLPGNHALLLVNPLVYTVMAVTEEFKQNSGRTTEQLLGKGLIESFPSNPKDPGDTGELNLRASLAKVLRSGCQDQLPVQRYDVIDQHGYYTQRYWVAKNKPSYIMGKCSILFIRQK